MKSPRVTVCIPTYNCAGYLPQAIESVLNQSFADFELLITDNCSQDDTRELVAGYARQDARVVYKMNARNLGMVGNWNVCLNDAAGEYIKYLFSDDILHSRHALQEMVAILDGDDHVSLVGSARNIIDEKSAIIDTVSHFEGGEFVDGKRVISRCLVEQRNLIGEPSVVMFRKSQALRGFDTNYRQLVDQEMWFHLLEQGAYAHIGEPLSSFRHHAEQQTRKNVRDMAHIDDQLSLLAIYLDKPYMRLDRLTKKFLAYSQNYRYWKLYRKGLVERELALKKISAHLGVGKFLLLLPFYKLYNPVWKVRRLALGQ